MSAVGTLTLAQLRLEWLSLEMQSLVARSVKNDRLREIVESYVPRRMLKGFDLRAKRDFDTLMWLRVEIDYEKHDQIVLSGEGLPAGISGRYTIGDGPRGANTAAHADRPSCPQVCRAIDQFMRSARDHNLEVSWDVNYNYRDLTCNGRRIQKAHTLLPELELFAAVAPEIAGEFDEKEDDRKCPPEDARSGDKRK